MSVAKRATRPTKSGRPKRCSASSIETASRQSRRPLRETLEERAAIPMDEILRAEDIIKKHLEEMFDEIGRDDLTQNSQQRYLLSQLYKSMSTADVLT